MAPKVLGEFLCLCGIDLEVQEEPCHSIHRDVGQDSEGISESCELHLLMVSSDQLWYEREVRDLGGCPAKLEDDNKWDEVDEGSPLRCILRAADAWAEDEGEGDQNTDGPSQVPGFPPPVAPTPAGLVRLVAHQGRADAVGHLPRQQQRPRMLGTIAQHRMEVDQQVGEPHRGAQVVQEMAY
uniref:Uncharacterized protein n=1 Tax=Micrurus lemniscatus lemniscatus TaxID=129467 RepID=A0A2D4IRH5_MICLE